MLDRGLSLLSAEMEQLAEGERLPGDVAFKLYDTFGFPLDLTQDALRETGREVDLPGFETSMQAQRARGAGRLVRLGEAATENLWFDLREKLGATEFLGYSTESAEAEILALISGGEEVASAPEGAEVAVILNQTPFYAESGGQVGDAGAITGAGFAIRVTDTQKKLGDLFVHYGRVESGVAQAGQPVVAELDHARRTSIRAHHSATHLLHESLRRLLGTHVSQKGSLNAPERLRFDVSHPKPITHDELVAVEAVVNDRIRENSEVTTRLMTPDEAVAEGAMALFGEKYGDEVRVVSMGGPEGNKSAWSIELCGGTHVRRTGDIGFFPHCRRNRGFRRRAPHRGVTGLAAEALVLENERHLQEAASALRANPAELADRLGALIEDRRRLERQVVELQKKTRDRGECRGRGRYWRHQAFRAQSGRCAAARPEGSGGGDRQTGGQRRCGAGFDGGGQGQYRRRGFA